MFTPPLLFHINKYKLKYIFCWDTPPTTFNKPQVYFGPATEFLRLHTKYSWEQQRFNTNCNSKVDQLQK